MITRIFGRAGAGAAIADDMANGAMITPVKNRALLTHFFMVALRS
jgi:hypothetical protein